MVGKSGYRELRRIRDIANARSLPAFTSGMAEVKSANIIETRPARMSVSAGAVVL
jgi:hypothetical protein